MAKLFDALRAKMRRERCVMEWPSAGGLNREQLVAAL